MKITKIEKKTVDNPKLELIFYFEGLISLNPSVMLTWTCPHCAGYGCGMHGNRAKCDDRIKIKSLKDIKNTFGENAAKDFKNSMLKFLDESESDE